MTKNINDNINAQDNKNNDSKQTVIVDLDVANNRKSKNIHKLNHIDRKNKIDNNKIYDNNDINNNNNNNDNNNNNYNNDNNDNNDNIDNNDYNDDNNDNNELCTHPTNISVDSIFVKKGTMAEKTKKTRKIHKTKIEKLID